MPVVYTVCDSGYKKQEPRMLVYFVTSGETKKMGPLAKTPRLTSGKIGNPFSVVRS